MADKIDEGGFAFPTQTLFAADGTFLGAGGDGMSLRDWSAGQALVGMGTWMPAGFVNLDTDEACKARAKFAYRQADAMIAARKAGA